ncbi:hypothetical protein [Saccharothrix obliqua]|uniref:hypothetical protein n=1 Tax=Saccharothrix obliqua TaxID=2861747 RepID=UPI001C5FD652|nr:hypothetical protein [Saccharothrix obliqua]MBW4719127.1 hypothetical protein [Saccharothrix obliqua]
MRAVTRPRRTAMRPVAVAAAVFAVAGVVAGAVWLVPSTQTADPATASTTTTTTTRNPIPTSADDLIARFKTVLGDTATFEVTQRTTIPVGADPSKNPRSDNPRSGQPGTKPEEVSVTRLDDPDAPALISGTLTSAGFTGGFALAIGPGETDPGDWCRISRVGDCAVNTLPDGSVLATGTGRPDAGAMTYMACVKRPDGTLIVLQNSNQEDPAGAVINSPGGKIYSPQPPLNLDQLKAIVTSDKW